MYIFTIQHSQKKNIFCDWKIRKCSSEMYIFITQGHCLCPAFAGVLSSQRTNNTSYVFGRRTKMFVMIEKLGNVLLKVYIYTSRPLSVPSIFQVCYLDWLVSSWVTYLAALDAVHGEYIIPSGRCGHHNDVPQSEEVPRYLSHLPFR